MAPPPKPLEVFERYEMKFLLDEKQYEQVKDVFLQHMIEDRYSIKCGGFYPIRNIYYDTSDDLLIRRSIQKPLYKEKLRLRSYGRPNAESMTFIEIKKKYEGLVSKRRIVLPLSQAEKYLEDGSHPEEHVNRQILKELDYFRKVYPLVPKVYLSYNRKALAGKEDPEFRVTFDRDITARREELSLDTENTGRLILPDGIYLMEVKISDAMPLWAARTLADAGVHQTSISKYGTEYMTDIEGKTLGEVIPDFFAGAKNKTPNAVRSFFNKK